MTPSTINAPSQKRPGRGGCLHLVKRGFMLVIFLLILLITGGFLFESVMLSTDAQRYPAPGKLINLDGRVMHLNCTGEGAPTIILETGAGNFSARWSEIQTVLSSTHHVCSYDRAGYGWSETSSEPRTAWQIVSELHTLLTTADIAPPYIMVGASNGGLYVRAYAVEYPEEVAGLVLVDTTFENTLDQLGSFPTVVFTMMGRLGIFRLFPEMVCPGTECPQSAKPMLAAFRGYTTGLNTYDAEWAALRDPDQIMLLQERIGQPGSLADTPLFILQANQSLLPQEQWPEPYRAAMTEKQEALIALSSNTQFLLIDGGHGIDSEHPEVVIEAVNSISQAIASTNRSTG